MKKIFVFVLCAAVCAIFLMNVNSASAAHLSQEEGNSNATPTRDPSITTLPLIIGIGQSNMAGRATMPPVGTATMTAVPGAKMLHWNGTSWVWVEMREASDVWNNNAPRTEWVTPGTVTNTPTRTPTPNGIGTPLPPIHGSYGPASAFIGEFMLHKTDWQEVGFINCAVGGSAVTSWAPDTVWAINADNMNDCWSRISSAMYNYRYQVVGVIVVNGETETANGTLAAGYPEAMNRLYQALVTRVKNPNLPMAYLKLGNPPPTSTPAASFTPGGPGGSTATAVPTRGAWGTVQAYQQTLPGTYPGNNWFPAGSLGITREPGSNYLHYASPAEYDKVGIRLARVLLTLMPTSTFTPTSTRTPTLTPTLTPTRTSTP